MSRVFRYFGIGDIKFGDTPILFKILRYPQYNMKARRHHDIWDYVMYQEIQILSFSGAMTCISEWKKHHKHFFKWVLLHL